MMRMMRELAREELESVLKGGQPGVPKDKPIKKTRKRGRSEPVLDLTRDRDLDEVIARLSMDILVDQVQLKRLKKRKLMLKDQIERHASLMIPDLNA